MSDVVITRAVNADLPGISWLRAESAREQDGGPDDPEFDDQFAAWFARESPRRITWLAKADNRAVGMMNMTIFERMPRPGRPPSRWGYLGNAFVLAAYRNQGIGGKLIGALLDYADGNGCARVVLSPSERAIPFYERVGFIPASTLLLRTPASGSSPRYDR